MMVAPPSDSFIAVQGLYKSFLGQPLYEDFNLSLPTNQLISIFGPNGCGKSTLINLISGLLPYDQGQITIHGK
ncbi:MAG: ATP-binding cassette domain-containing protein, partial [Nodosilinea sp.]